MPFMGLSVTNLRESAPIECNLESAARARKRKHSERERRELSESAARVSERDHSARACVVCVRERGSIDAVTASRAQHVRGSESTASERAARVNKRELSACEEARAQRV